MKRRRESEYDRPGRRRKLNGVEEMSGWTMAMIRERNRLEDACLQHEQAARPARPPPPSQPPPPKETALVGLLQYGDDSDEECPGGGSTMNTTPRTTEEEQLRADVDAFVQELDDIMKEYDGEHTPEADKDLRGAWRRVKCTETDEYYYWNIHTQETTWDVPAEWRDSSAAEASEPSAALIGASHTTPAVAAGAPAGTPAGAQAHHDDAPQTVKIGVNTASSAANDNQAVRTTEGALLIRAAAKHALGEIEKLLESCTGAMQSLVESNDQEGDATRNTLEVQWIDQGSTKGSTGDGTDHGNVMPKFMQIQAPHRFSPFEYCFRSLRTVAVALHYLQLELTVRLCDWSDGGLSDIFMAEKLHKTVDNINYYDVELEKCKLEVEVTKEHEEARRRAAAERQAASTTAAKPARTPGVSKLEAKAKQIVQQARLKPKRLSHERKLTSLLSRWKQAEEELRYEEPTKEEMASMRLEQWRLKQLRSRKQK